MAKKIEQISSTPKQSQCSFCYNPSEEVKILLRASIQGIKRIQLHPKYRQNVPHQVNAIEASLGLHRLIRVLFDKQQFQIKFSKNCPHLRLRNLFCQKLKCKGPQLQHAIEELCDKIGRKNYELEVISLQVKNVQHSVIQLQDLTLEASTKTVKQGLSSQEQLIQSPIIDQMVKMEQSFQSQKQLILPATSTIYQQPFENMPFSYSIYFYESPYLQ